jgi:hypothetical protein
MILADLDTWPSPLMAYLASQHQMLAAYARHESTFNQMDFDSEGDYVPMSMRPSNPHFHGYESAWLKINNILKPTTLRGWHCTRLTDQEMEHIRSQGMQPPNLDILVQRIRRAEAAGKFGPEIAARLITENQADDDGRKGMIWFCFFEPRLAGQSGTERFFRRWGGESLYNSHERDADTGEALRLIGRPCLIQADVPISSFGRISGLGQKVIRRYLLAHDYDTGESWEHEDKARAPISAANIVKFVLHGDPEFTNLTGCDSWKPPLC